MTISKENKDFIDSLIDYYISESESYRQIAENFVPEVESVPDTAFETWNAANKPHSENF